MMESPAQMYELTIKQLERAIMIREWGAMCRIGIGMGYGSCTLNDGRGADPALSVEEFTRINDAVNNLPVRPKAVITHIYKLENGIRETALKLGDTRRNIDRHHKQALDILYGKLCY